MSVSISPSGLLSRLLAGGSVEPAEARLLAREENSEALFRIVVEGLADRFEPALCDAYVDVFSEVLETVMPQYGAAELRDRYRRIRTPRSCNAEPETVFVLSRVTIGADIAVTGVVLSAARKRFPAARIVFVGSERNAELFGFEHVAAPYPRSGSLRDRLEASRALGRLLGNGTSVVLDPDSRLTQLGLLPVCEEERYFFFESRSAGGDGNAALPKLAADWCERVLGTRGDPFLRCLEAGPKLPSTLNLGVGKNLEKRVGDAFEAGLVRELGEGVTVDLGAESEEAERVKLAISRAGVRAETWEGTFAGFAGRIARSRLYAGYDSAGQHAAAALGIPLVTVFRGQVSRRMFERWKPTGPGPMEIVDANGLSEEEALGRTVTAIRKIRRLSP